MEIENRLKQIENRLNELGKERIRKRNKKIVIGLSLVFVMSFITLVNAGLLDGIGDLFGEDTKTLTTSEKVISYDYVDKVNAIDFELATEKAILSKGINSAESYLRIPSEKERPAKIILMTDDKLKGVWLKQYSIKTETITEQIQDKCLKFDEKENCIEWSYITSEYDKTSDSWDLLTTAKETLTESFSTQVYDLSWNVILKSGQNDFRYFIEGANGNFSFKVIYLDDYKESILDPFVNASWQWKAIITLNESMINGTHENFPVLLTEDNMPVGIWALANINGSDIRFSNDSAGSEELAREIVSWNNVTNKTEIWVKVNLTDATSKNITIWYDYNDATDYAPSDTYGRNNVWKDYWVVSHLEYYNTTDVVDSTGNYNFLQKLSANNPLETTGIVGTGQNFSSDHIAMPYLYLNDSFALNIWAKDDGVADNYEGYISPGTEIYKGYIMVRDATASNMNFFSSSAAASWNIADRSVGVISTDWNQHIVTRNGASFNTYRNGAVVESWSSSLTTMTNGATDPTTYFGRFRSGSNNFYLAGSLDEIRIANISYSLERQKTEYDNIRTPNLFATAGVGTPNADTTPPTYSCSFNQTYAGNPTQLSCVFSDALLHPKGQYNITLNNTGSYVSIANGNFSTTPQTITYDFTLNDTTDIEVCAKVLNITDNSGNVNSTQVSFCITTVIQLDKVYFKWWNNETKNYLFAQINRTIGGLNKFEFLGDIYANNYKGNGNINITGNFTGNQIYGGMWYHNHTATSLNFAVDSQFYPLFFINATHLNGFGAEGLGIGLASNLTTQVAGVYQVNYMAAGDGQNNHIYHTSVFVNEVNQLNCDTIHKMASGGDIITQTGVCLIDLEVGDKVSLRTADVGSTGTGNYYGSNLDLVRLGD